MLSSNFYYRLIYQFKNAAIYPIFMMFIKDRLMHPFLSQTKKKFKKKHRDFLKSKNTSTDYFSINAYYWNKILNKNFKKFSYLEIGSLEGNSALYILKNHLTKKVVCVDLWDLDIFLSNAKKNFNNFIKNLQEFENKYSYFKMKSDDFFHNNKEFFDVIYIDGWHGASQVRKDISNSWKFLRVGGIIICDDYFYEGDSYKNSDKDIPAPEINYFIRENQKNIKILCVNNNQIFLKKTQ
ncbi:class I SAM-dependent methyltransferase [Candidatus Pelagibacter ubique]|jgi:predicted O-methyltransferase YrrM|nr:class I SAM-dependent methyltransferase [Candidatus Pelagibacter ubique]